MGPSLLPWLVGAWCVAAGLILVVAPERFADWLPDSLRDYRTLLGIGWSVVGLGLLGAAARRATGAEARVWGGLGGAALVLLAALQLPRGDPLALLGYALLALAWGWTVATAAALHPPPAAPRAEPGPDDRQARPRDVLTALAAVTGALAGLLLAAAGPGAPPRAYGLVLALVAVLVLLTSRAGARGQTASPLRLVFALLLAGLAPLYASARGDAVLAAYLVLLAAGVAAAPWWAGWSARLDARSLRTRLAAVLALTLAIPLIALVAVADRDAEEVAVAVALARREALAEALADDIAHHEHLVRASVAALASLPVMAADAPDAQTPLLRAVASAYPELLAVIRFDGQGREAVRSHPVALDDRTVRQVHDAVRAANGSIVRLSPDEGAPHLLLGEPIRAPDGALAGVLVAVADTARLLPLLDSEGLLARANVYVVAADGSTVSQRAAEAAGRTGALPDRPPMAAALRGATTNGALRYRDERGEWLAGYARVPRLGWAAVVESPASAVTAAADRSRTWSLAIVLLVLVLAALAGWLIARWIAAPLTALAGSARALAEGDASAPLPRSEVTEIAALTDDFDLMRRRVAARQAESVAARAALHALNAALGHRLAQRSAELEGALQDLDIQRGAREQIHLALQGLEARLQNQFQALQTLITVDARQLADRPDLDAALRAFSEIAAATLDVERVGLWLYSADRTLLRCLDLYERSADRHSAGIELTAADYPTYFRALAEGRTIAADTAIEDPRTAEFAQSYLSPLGITSLLDAQLRVGGQLAGVVCHEHVGPARRWTLDEQSFAASIADLISLRLEVHEHWRADQELRQQEARLQQAQRMETLGRLAGGVAHDFNNLLTVIVGCTELLRAEVESTSSQAALLEEIAEAGERAAGLTRQLLTFSRRGPASAGLVDLNAVVTEASRLLRRLLGEDIELAVQLEPALWLARGDANQLQQVLMNLAVNARDAMPRGGTLAIETANVTLGADRHTPQGTIESGAYVVVTVADTGAGMDAATLQRLFEPFFTTKASGQGTGLGLAIVQGIVAQYGGQVTVESTPGAGTTFSCWLPRAERDEAQPAAPGSS